MISTGRGDWARRIEDDGEGTGWGELGKKLKNMLGRGGKFADLGKSPMTASVLVWSPGDGTKLFRNVDVSDENVENFVKSHLLPDTLHSDHDKVSDDQKSSLLRDSSRADKLEAEIDPWDTPVILICGHGGRDERCGILGPLLQNEVSHAFNASTPLSHARPGLQPVSFSGDPNKLSVGLCSHIGGHRFAGNVLIYFPKYYGSAARSEGHSLQGHGVWYGRVEPRHIEGILHRTVHQGEIIEELLRGTC
ncbi:MAG: hypothetical protein Q9227_002981 [Pyrenula ochraceoflavens]